nr:3560_t:CDS:2 [Entrophospora candida]
MCSNNCLIDLEICNDVIGVIGEIDVEKLNKVFDLEDELGNLESLLLIEDQKEDDSEDDSEAGGESGYDGDEEVMMKTVGNDDDNASPRKRRRIRCFYVVDSGCETSKEVSN